MSEIRERLLKTQAIIEADRMIREQAEVFGIEQANTFLADFREGYPEQIAALEVIVKQAGKNGFVAGAFFRAVQKESND